MTISTNRHKKYYWFFPKIYTYDIISKYVIIFYVLSYKFAINYLILTKAYSLFKIHGLIFIVIFILGK